MEGWKYRSWKLLKALFCHQKNPKKQTFSWNLHENSSDIYMKCLNPQVRINKMVNKHTVDYHPSPSELTSRIHPLIFLWTSKGFIIYSKCFLNFFKPVFWTMVAEKFQIHGVKITGKCICESKNWICLFLLMSLSKSLSQVIIITTAGRKKLTICPKPFQQKGRRITELKK